MRIKDRAKAITLIELIAVAVGLGVLALIVAPNVENALGLTKNAVLATNLSEMQDASDNFYAIANAYPTYPGTSVGNQPSSSVWGTEINYTADPQNLVFVPGFLHSQANAAPATYGLSPASGAEVYFGVENGGQVFATQSPPTFVATGEYDWPLMPSEVYLPTGPVAGPATVPATVVSTVGGLADPQGVAVNTLTDTVYVANIDNDTVSVIDGVTNTITWNVSVGDNPRGVAVDPNTNMIYVTNTSSDTVSVIDGATNTIVATVPVGSYPYDVAVDQHTNMIYVSNKDSNTVSVINGTTNTLATTVPLSEYAYPKGIAVDPVTNIVYVVNWGLGTVSVIDGGTNAVAATVNVQEWPMRVAVDTSTGMVYVSNEVSNTVSVINGATNTVTATVAVGSQPQGVTIDQNTNMIYVVNDHDSTVSVINGANNQVVTLIHTTEDYYPSEIAVNPATNTIYVVQYNSVCVIRQ